ncbi:Crp/Fnr family transcriptional regulator [Chrysiogenes arsenatis]|uniref:Crp/Fnr family transcriptional regulator n=1 Tax=Chrysiogenes arsenatis TaxID=309797 RepID=UPI000417EEB7|nr:cyclic nucleotide-binding domain-containing protein [Chrysiogenes arsenatis]
MAKSDVLFYRKGTIVFEEGDNSRDVFVIKSGRFEVFKKVGGKVITIAIVEPGAIIGEMAFIDNKPRSAGIRAYEDGYLIRISEDQLRREIGSMPKWLGSLFKVLSSRVRSTSEELAKLSYNNWVTMANTLEQDFPKNPTFRFTDYEGDKVYIHCDATGIDVEDSIDLKGIVSTYLTVGRKKFFIDLSSLLSFEMFSVGVIYSIVIAIQQCGGEVTLSIRSGLFNRFIDVYDTTDLDKACLYSENENEALQKYLGDIMGLNERFRTTKVCGYCAYENDTKSRYCISCGASFVGYTVDKLFSKIKGRVKVTREQPLIPLISPSQVTLYPLCIEGMASRVKGLVMKIAPDHIEIVAKNPVPKDQLYGLDFQLSDRAMKLIGLLVKIEAPQGQRNMVLRFDLVKANKNELDVIAAIVTKARS